MEKLGQFTPPLKSLSPGPVNERPPLDPRLQPCSPTFAAEQTKRLVGSFRKGQAEDPRQFAASIATVFSAYPEWVVRMVVHPLNGLPGLSDWMPHVSEVRAACEKHMAGVRARVAQEGRIAETQALLAAPAPATTEERERAYREYMERIRPGLKGEVAQTRAQVEEAAKKRLKELYHDGINGKGSLTLSAEAVELAKAKALARGEALA
jgi:hypothetical protein